MYAETIGLTWSCCSVTLEFDCCLLIGPTSTLAMYRIGPVFTPVGPQIKKYAVTYDHDYAVPDDHDDAVSYDHDDAVSYDHDHAVSYDHDDAVSYDHHDAVSYDHDDGTVSRATWTHVFPSSALDSLSLH